MKYSFQYLQHKEVVGIIAPKEYVSLRNHGLPFNIWIQERPYFFWSLGWHEFAELICVLEGEVVQTVNKTTCRLSKGDLVFINGMDMHSIYSEPGVSAKLLLMQIPPSFISLFYRETHPIRVTKNFFINSKQKAFSRDLKSCINDIVEEFTQKKEGYKYFLTAHVYKLLGILFRSLPSVDSNDKEYLEQRLIMDKISPALDYINSCYKTDISVQIAASKAGMCTQYFCKCFKKATTYTFTQYVNELRVMSAQDLLLTTDMNVTEVAYAVGFSSINYFNRIFKNISGTTAMDFRRR